MQTGIDIDNARMEAAKRIICNSQALFRLISLAVLTLCFIAAGFAQNKYDNRPVAKVDVTFGETGDNPQLAEEFRLKARDEVGAIYNSARIRDAIEALYRTKKVETITVAANLNADEIGRAHV